MSDTVTDPSVSTNPTNPTDPTDPAADPGLPEAGVLMVADVEQAVSIIDHACEQGAFKGWPTIEAVYTTRQRLANFVLRVKPATEAPAGTDGSNRPDGADPEASPQVPAAVSRSAGLTGAAAKATV